MRIVLVVDDSASSADAVETVADRLWPSGTTVRVLSIVAPVRPELHFGSDTLELAQKEMTRKAESLTARVTDVLRARGLAVDSAVTLGDPASQIVNEARQWPANLIVLGANSYTSEGEETSCVARSVANHGACKVEVVEQGAVAVEREIHSGSHWTSLF
jgi:nucleotide-binding universal stress UspA family protein